MADEPKTGAEQLDLAEVRKQLGLPETATEQEIIVALLTVIATLQQKYDAVLADAVDMEQKVANRDLEDFADVITNDSRPFWAEQLLANRDRAVAVLTDLRTKKPAAPAPAAAPRVPLANRVAQGTKPVTEVIEGKGAVDVATAEKIRNRALEIRGREGVPYMIAFSRAERELAGQ